MLEIVVTDRFGQTRIIEANPQGTLLQALHDGGDDNLLAICGGCCSCGTCHIYVDDTCLAALPAPEEDEAALLEGLEYRRDISRLACQVKLSESLPKLYITIPPEE